MTLRRSVLHERAGVFPPTSMGAGRRKRAVHPLTRSVDGHEESYSSSALHTINATVPTRNITAMRAMRASFFALHYIAAQHSNFWRPINGLRSHLAAVQNELPEVHQCTLADIGHSGNPWQCLSSSV